MTDEIEFWEKVIVALLAKDSIASPADAIFFADRIPDHRARMVDAAADAKWIGFKRSDA